jgi:hypothetical protein
MTAVQSVYGNAKPLQTYGCNSLSVTFIDYFQAIRNKNVRLTWCVFFVGGSTGGFCCKLTAVTLSSYLSSYFQAFERRSIR